MLEKFPPSRPPELNRRIMHNAVILLYAYVATILCNTVHIADTVFVTVGFCGLLFVIPYILRILCLSQWDFVVFCL